MKKLLSAQLTIVFACVFAVMLFGFAQNTIGGDQKDIVDTAVGAGSFNTLVAAVKAADLVDTLKGKGPLKPENKEKLKGILTYHVVPGKVMAADVVKLKTAKTVQGQELTIKVSGETVMVDNAKVTKTDIACSNGVIHVIDTVVLPK
jgi:uncharacterized surface protein with fasciclin (FAS1) repeats